MDVMDLKRQLLEGVARHREKLRASPHLVWLFFEITSRCNLRCKHCGSSCTTGGEMLTVCDIKKTLATITGEKPMICLTGGEPTLHPNFFEIANAVYSMGFSWGMTTNATLIDDSFAAKLKEVGMSTVSVSLDGLESSHDLLRQQKGAWQLAVRGIKALQGAGFEPQVTTVVHEGNFEEIEKLYLVLSEMGITSWRIINVEPIGRACESGDLMLSSQHFAQMIEYIRNKRFDPNCRMTVTFGCSHYLGTQYERMVRDHYFLCAAGILTASVRSNGDICACLDIVNIPRLVQGNIKTDDFMNVWENKFGEFRKDRTAECEKCLNCSQRFVCGGDSAHTWDYEENKPLFCYYDFGNYLK